MRAAAAPACVAQMHSDLRGRVRAVHRAGGIRGIAADDLRLRSRCLCSWSGAQFAFWEKRSLRNRPSLCRIARVFEKHALVVLFILSSQLSSLVCHPWRVVTSSWLGAASHHAAPRTE